MTDDIVARLRADELPGDRQHQREARVTLWAEQHEAADEIERLRERRDDWRAAMTENHDLWRENERLRAALREIAKHDTDADGNWGFFRDEADEALREASDDAAT